MFGSQNSTFGGGFGSQSQPQSLFGAPFGGFGASTSAGGTGFGGFRPSAASSGSMFGGGNPFGSTSGVTAPNGTLNPPYATTSDKDPSGALNTFHSITAMPQYRNFSFEELRMSDYQLNRKPSAMGSSYVGINTPTYGTTSTGSGFGSFGSQTPAFGAKSTPSFAFGNTTPTVGFGATPAAGPSTQSLFGAQKPAFGAPTGGFGSTTQATASFGTGSGFGVCSVRLPLVRNLAYSAQRRNLLHLHLDLVQLEVLMLHLLVLVGNKPTSVASGFGTPSTTPSFGGFSGSTGTGLFGTTTTTSGNLFTLNPPASTSAPSLGIGFSAFNKPAAPILGGSGLSTLQTQPSSFLGSGSTLSFGNAGTATAFGNIGQTQGLQATVNKAPYGEISVFQETTPTATPTKPSVAATPVTTTPQRKKSGGTPSYKLTPKPSSKLKLPGFSSHTYPGFGTPDVKPLHIFESLDKKEILNPEAFTKRNPRKLVLDRSVEPEEMISETDSRVGSPQNDHTPVKQRVSFDAKLESGADNIYHSFSPNIRKPSIKQTEFSDNIASTPSKTPSKTPLNAPPKESSRLRAIETEDSPKKELFTLTSPDNDGYYSVPSIKDLSEMRAEELKSVVGFMAGRTNYGKIEFQEPVDFSDIPLDDVLGKVIRFEDQSSTVYGSEYNKPPPGQGLNKKAIITLDRCWALDKSDRRPIKDPEDFRYRHRVERLKNVLDTKYITFLPETGSWVFQVEHFTTYGLILDDPEDQFEEKQYRPFEVPIINMTETKSFPRSRKGKEKEYDDDKLKPVANFPESLGQDPDDIDEMQNVLFNDSNEEDYMQMDIGGDSIIEEFDDSHKRNLENDDNDEDIEIENRSSVVEPRQSFVKTPRISHEDVVIRLPSKYRKIVDYADSIVFGKDSCKEDLGLMMGRSFRDKEKVRHDSSMKFIFENSVFGREDGIPHVDVDLARVNFENLLKSFENGTISKHETLTWKLGYALWDDIVIPGVNRTDSEDFDKLTEEYRKERISKWFKEAVSSQTTAHIKRAISSNDKGEIIFGYLTSRNILNASKTAVKNRDFRLAALLSQLCGNDKFFKDKIKNQIDHWQETGLVKLIPKGYLRLYEIMAGNVAASNKGLDWKRALGMHLWYGRYLDETFAASFNDYETAQKNSGVVPIPWYKEEFERKPSLSWPESENVDEIYDVHYHLLKLAVDKTHSLDNAILPRSITPHLWIIGDFVDQGSSADLVTSNLVTQLEVLGLWRWALLASLFLNEPHVRKTVICELLNRLVSTIPVDQLESIENFADQIKIPRAWIAKAKALYSKYKEETVDEAMYLLNAGDVSDAHKIVITKIAPESILHKKHKELQEILEKIDPQSVPDWDLGGKIFLDYLLFVATANVEEEENPTKITDLMGVCQNIVIGLAKMKPVDYRCEQCISYMEYLTNQVLSQIEGCDIKNMKFQSPLTLSFL
ncbi:6809_t:CDS:10 [Acaulospora colombiana]|uniref:6809_t:CDS:1 n=1 Tax=Acaulospora colombiana TaxID=27376 RepID=A0ACA9M9P0_9GLOM|nr:6809_t:CDS:10 [Acaulospora colombiana]